MDIDEFLDKKLEENNNILKNKNGDIIYLYHGTNRKFENHSMEKNRTILNNNYQGDWICYTADKKVAWKYSNAARNQTFDKPIFLSETRDFLKRSNLGDYENHIYDTLVNIMELGFDKGWKKSFEDYSNKTGTPLEDSPRNFFSNLSPFEKEHNFYLDDIISSLKYVEYSKSEMYDDDDDVNFFMGSGINMISNHTIEMLKDLGYEKCLPEPKIFKSMISASNILETSNRKEAQEAKKNGFDLVIYSGEGTVDGEPEYLIADPKQVFIRSMELEHKYEEKNDCDYDTVTIIERKKVDLRNKNNRM